MPLDSNVNYINYDDVLVGENHPLGLTDTINRPTKELAAKFDAGLADTQVSRTHIKINSATDVAIGVASDDYVWFNPSTSKYEKTSSDFVLGVIDLDLLVIYTSGLTRFKTKNDLVPGAKYYLSVTTPGAITTSELSGIMVGIALGTGTIMNVADSAAAAANSTASGGGTEVPVDVLDVAVGVATDDIVYYNTVTSKFEKAFDYRAIGIIDLDLQMINPFGFYTFRTINNLVKGVTYYLDASNPGKLTTSDESGVTVGTAFATNKIMNIIVSGGAGGSGGFPDVVSGDAYKEITNNGVEGFWSPIRLNPSIMTTSFTVPTGANGQVAGPFIVGDSAILTVADGAVFVIN